MELQIAYWFPPKKANNINFSDFITLCNDLGIKVDKFNLEDLKSVEEKYRILLHKFTGLISKSLNGCKESKHLVEAITQFADSSPNTIFLDSLESHITLLHRGIQYQVVQQFLLDAYPKHSRFFVPYFTELRDSRNNGIRSAMLKAGLRFPVLCKQLASHGWKNSHEMCLVFNENGMKQVQLPCIAQNFINHDGQLHKVFVIGQYIHIVPRPSIKNLYSRLDQPPVFFDSQTISKEDSDSDLTISLVDPVTAEIAEELKNFARTAQKCLNMQLFGIDVIVEKATGRLGIIDVNVFPGYSGVNNFHYRMLDMILAIAQK